MNNNEIVAHVFRNTTRVHSGWTDCDACGHGPEHAVHSAVAVPDTSLSLLVIDLGDSCVVKVEKGDVSELPQRIAGAQRTWNDALFVVSTPFHGFDGIREEVDGDKPLPRIEKNLPCNKPYTGIYQLITSEDDDAKMHTLYQHEIDALSELAGKPLPIWDGGGTWTELPDAEADDRSATCDFSFGFRAAKDQLPFKAWRYTRGGE